MLANLGDTFAAAGDASAACISWRDALAIFDELDHPDAERLRARLATAPPGPPHPGTGAGPMAVAAVAGEPAAPDTAPSGFRSAAPDPSRG